MLSPIKNTKVYENVIQQIKELVRNGELKSGDRLPSERDLTEQLQVSRTSIREALRALEMLGLVESRQGEGNFIKDNFESSLLEPLSIVFMLLGSKADEILELRKIIEPETAALAAKNITNEQIFELREIINMLNETDDKATSASWDKKFHYKIIQVSGNRIISNIMFSVSSLIEAHIENTCINMFDKDLIRKQHLDIYNAIETHNPIAASNAVRKHLEYTNQFNILH